MFAAYVLLTFGALVLAAAVSRGGGGTLWLALLVLGWVVSQFNTLLEAVVFSVMPWSHAAIQLAISFAALALLSGLALLVTLKWRGRAAEPTQLNATPVTLGLAILAYELLYWTAGILVWPYVADFYADKHLPSVFEVAALQVPRALLFVAAAWLWLKTRPRWAPLVLGIAYAVMGGIAPMLPDNPYMTLDVRVAHGVETGTSNFIFGLIVGWLIQSRSGQKTASAESLRV